MVAIQDPKTHSQPPDSFPLLKTVRQIPAQITTNTLANVRKASESYKSTEAASSSFWGAFGTGIAGLSLAVGLLPGLPTQLRPVRAVLAPVVIAGALEGTKGHVRRAVKAKELKRLERNKSHDRAKENLTAVYEPWAARRLNPLGGTAEAISSVLNFDPNAVAVSSAGVEEAGTYTRYLFVVKFYSAHVDLFKYRERVASAAMTTQSVTFQWIKGFLAIDIGKPPEQCHYTTVKEKLGNDRQQVILPLGMAMERLVTKEVGDLFNGFAIVGEPGSGKTLGAKGIIQFLGCRHHPSVVQYWMSEPQMSKASSFPMEEFEGDPHLFKRNSYSYAQTLQVMAATIYECRSRSKIFEKAGVASLDAYNRITERPLPRIFGFVDECENFFDNEICDPAYQYPFLRMALILARMTRSQGGHLILLPKSMAAGTQSKGSADMFPIPLRRTFGGGICLKVPNITDAEIALQGNADDEYLLKSIPHLPKSGAAVVRENGTLTRVQMLFANKPTNKMPIVGRGVLPMPDHSLPDLLEVLEEFSSPRIAEDDELAIILEKEGLNYKELIDMMSGKCTLSDLRSGKKPKKFEKADPPATDYESMRRTYETYKSLRQVPGASYTSVITKMSGEANPASKQYANVVASVEAAVYQWLNEWIAELDPNLADEAIVTTVFARKGNEKTWQRRLARVREVRKKLSASAAERN